MLLVSSLVGQEKGLAVGALVGGANYQGDLVDASFVYGNETNIGGGLYLRKNFSKMFAARLNFNFGKLSGNDQNNSDERLLKRDFAFTNSVSEIAVGVEIQPFPESPVNAYALLGLGYSFFNATTTRGNSTPVQLVELYDKDVAEKENNKSAFAIPIGFGLRYGVTPKVKIGAEVGFHAVFTDYLDGISLSGNPNRNDSWLSFGVGVDYQIIGGKDRDKDGIIDKEDRCPRKPGLKKFKGCPDTDNDGIPDRVDRCPNLPGPRDLKGCPDSDGDGVVDVDDLCPNDKGARVLQGCPDMDGDGVIDMEDHCPNSAGLRGLNGCPDTDGDGIVDPNDMCPDEKGTFENNGCPDKN